jgi:hypothetical protein
MRRLKRGRRKRRRHSLFTLRGRGEKGFGEEEGERRTHLEKRAHKRRRGNTKSREHKEKECTIPRKRGALDATACMIY